MPPDLLPSVLGLPGWLRRRLEGRRPEPSSGRYNEDELARVRDRWLTSKKLVEKLSDMFGVRPLFVWQPVPTYRYDYQHYHLLRDLGVEPVKWGAARRFGYPLMARHRAELEQGKNFLWLVHMQEGRRGNLYVDEYHYTAAFMKDIAAYICAYLVENQYLADVNQGGPRVSAIPTLGGPKTPPPADNARR